MGGDPQGAHPPQAVGRGDFKWSSIDRAIADAASSSRARRLESPAQPRLVEGDLAQVDGASGVGNGEQGIPADYHANQKPYEPTQAMVTSTPIGQDEGKVDISSVGNLV